MNKRLNITLSFVGALILAASLLPSAAFARDGEDSGATLPDHISTLIESEDSGDRVSANSTTTVTLQDEGENSDNNNNQGDEDSSTKHRQNDTHQSVTSKHESDEADSEIDIDHDSADTATTTIDAPEQVTNHGELRGFLNHIVKEDDRIADVHISSSTIETHYEMPARFLWAIPTNLTADVSVNSGGSVTVTYPWYAFLFAKHDGDLAAQLQQSATSTNASTIVSASTQAHLLNLLFSVLKGSAEQ